MSTALVNYSKQINAAHKACQDAKILGGQKAHECGTWLIKQKEALPHGQWEKWVKEHCEFKCVNAWRYMEIAKLNFSRVKDLSLNGALDAVAQEKADDAAWDEAMDRMGQGQPELRRGATTAHTATTRQRPRRLSAKRRERPTAPFSMCPNREPHLQRIFNLKKQFQ